MPSLWTKTRGNCSETRRKTAPFFKFLFDGALQLPRPNETELSAANWYVGASHAPAYVDHFLRKDILVFTSSVTRANDANGWLQFQVRSTNRDVIGIVFQPSAPRLCAKNKSYSSPTRTMNRAIDTGYGWTKFTTSEMARQGDRLHIGVGAFQSLPFVAKSSLDTHAMAKTVKTIKVKVNGITYQLAEKPSEVAPEKSERVEGDRFTQSNPYAVCMCAAVKEMGVDHIDNLVVGTPVSNFEGAKRVLMQRFGAGLNFDDKEVPIKALHVIAQPVGGLVWHVLSRNRQGELNDRRRLLVDVGYGTLDWVVANGLTTNSERSGSAEFGVSKFVELVAGAITEGGTTIGQSLELYEAIDALLTRDVPFNYRNKRWDREVFSEAIDRMASEGVQKLLSKVGDIGLFDSVVLMGGGSRIYQRVLHEHCKPIPIELVADSRFANVRGFQLISENQAQRARANK